MIKVKSGPADANFKGIVAQMVLWPAADLPAGWLPCDGRLVHAAEYPLLQKVVATGNPALNGPVFHLPQGPSIPEIVYIICVEGQDPTAGANGPVVQDDDDY